MLESLRVERAAHAKARVLGRGSTVGDRASGLGVQAQGASYLG